MIYHYTIRTSSHLGRILNENVILREGETGRTFTVLRLPCVWFSRRSDFEPTSAKLGKGLSLEASDMRASLSLAARIGVAEEVASLTWRDYKHRVRAIPTFTRRERMLLDYMEDVGRRVGARSSDWHATTERVGRERWQSVQVYAGGEWVDLNGDVRDYLAPATPLTAAQIDLEAQRLTELVRHKQLLIAA